MHRHTVPLPSSASAPLADRSSHSHAATTSRTAATVRAVPRGPRRVGCRDDVAGEGVSDYLTPAAGLHIRSPILYAGVSSLGCPGARRPAAHHGATWGGGGRAHPGRDHTVAVGGD
ncbi:hypothetical protein VPH35_012995 [Triticum aestivum]